MPDTENEDSTENGFQFIVSSGPRPDPALRKTIRRQAMKEAGLQRRRRNQTFEKQTTTQETNLKSPTIVSRSDSSSTWSDSTLNFRTDSTPCTEFTRSDKSIATDHDIASFEQHLSLYPSLDFASGEYWNARLNSSIDLSFLTILTNFNIGKSTIANLSSSICRLPSVFAHRQWSYLEYVPQRYPYSPCLAAATDCILAKVGNVLSPCPSVENSTLRLYAKALRLVQSAVTGSSFSDPDVLCAVQLLSLSELFDAPRKGAWASHIEGSTRLIKHRSVSRFEIEYERALFAASVGPHVSECLYNGTHCYLNEPQWKELYLSLALSEPVSSLSERSQLVLELRSRMFALPGMWSDIGHAIEGDDLFDDDVLISLAKRCRDSQAGYLDSLEQYSTHVLQTAFSQPSPGELALRREVYGLAHEGLILVKRLQASVCDPDRLTLEAEVRSASQNILDMQNQPSPEYSWLFSGHELGVARLALETSDHFMEDVSTQSWKNQRIAMRKRYTLWSDRLRAF